MISQNVFKSIFLKCPTIDLRTFLVKIVFKDVRRLLINLSHFSMEEIFFSLGSVNESIIITLKRNECSGWEDQIVNTYTRILANNFIIFLSITFNTLFFNASIIDLFVSYVSTYVFFGSFRYKLALKI